MNDLGWGHDYEDVSGEKLDYRQTEAWELWSFTEQIDGRAGFEGWGPLWLALIRELSSGSLRLVRLSDVEEAELCIGAPVVLSWRMLQKTGNGAVYGWVGLVGTKERDFYTPEQVNDLVNIYDY